MRRIDGFEEYDPIRRGALKAAVTFLSRVTEIPLEALVLDPRTIGRISFREAVEAQGLTASSGYTYRTNLRTVFWKLDLTDHPCRSTAPLPPDLAGLRDSLSDKYMSMWLQSFLGFCAETGVFRDRIADPTLAAYRDHLTTRRLARNPGQQVRKVAKAWNHAADTVPGWPNVRLRAPAQHQNYSLPLTEYPESFQRDVDKFRQWMTCEGEGGLYTSNRRQRGPARPATVVTRIYAIRVAAAALVHSGMPIAEITSLAVLVEHLKTINDWHWRRAGGRASRTARKPLLGKVTDGTGQIAETLRIIAKYHLGLTGPALAEIAADTKIAKPPQRSRMTAKNEQRLLQFEDRSVEARLLHFPNRLLKEASALRARNRDHEAAWMAGLAVAVEIELYCPMRLKNLTNIRIGHDLVRLDSRSKHWTHILVPTDDGKTDVALTWPIEPESARVIEIYLRDFRPLLTHSGTAWLFPSRDRADQPRDKAGLGQAISDAIRKFIGIEMNTHFFRAFAGAQILADNPGALQDLRLILGHTTLRTSLTYYASHSAKRATQNLGRLVTRKRNESRLVAAAAFAKPKPKPKLKPKPKPTPNQRDAGRPG
jgi:hypothetical protein